MKNTFRAGAVEGFLAIPVTSLCPNSIPEFDLFICPGDDRAPVLYREKDLPFSEAVKNRLNENGVSRLYVRTSDSAAYGHYVERHLPKILADPSIPPVQRTGILYGSAHMLMEELMQNPRSKALIERSEEMAGNAVNFIFSRSFSVQALLNVTCYDYYTYTHSVNVFMFSISLARHLKYSMQDALTLGNGALLHDIGKSKLDPAIVRCPGRLSKEQWDSMRLHPVYGEELLREQGITDASILDITRHHHEKMDGSGYPDGISGGDISSFARITTICDIFDALTTRRSYKDAMNSFQGLHLMKDEMQNHLDQDMFREFIMLLSNREGSNEHRIA